MNFPYKSTALATALAGMLCIPLVWADDELPKTDLPETEAVTLADRVPGSRIAAYFGDFFGEGSEAVVAGLRDGSIRYVEPLPEIGEPVEGAEPIEEIEVVDDVEVGAGMGYGNVLITMALAEQLAEKSALEAPEGEMGLTPNESLNEILRMRQVDRMGWGKIAGELDVNLGSVISGIRSHRPDMSEKFADHEEKAAARDFARGERMAKVGKPEKAEKVAKAERPDHIEKMAKVDRPERPARPEKPQRPER